MTGPLVTYEDIRAVLSELQQLRRLRRERKERISSRIHRRSYRRKLEKHVQDHWPGGYVLLENNDFLYIPKNLDYMALQRLIEPFRPEPIIEKFCTPGATVIDIGANLGEWSLTMARNVGPEGRLFSFEPIPFMCEAVRKTLQINRLFHASVFECAVSDKTGMADFFIHYDDNDLLCTGGSSLGAPLDRPEMRLSAEKAKPVRVKTITLDEFVSEQGISKLDFMKVDVETYEHTVLEGGKKTLEKYTPPLVVECGNPQEKAENRQRIYELLKPLSYEIVGILLLQGVIEANWEQYLQQSPPFIQHHAHNVLILPASPANK